MSRIVKFGEDVDGYDIPVLNEREIRAAAGLLFLMMFIAIAAAISTRNFLLLKYAIAIFLPDMLIRVFISPRYSPSLILGGSSSGTRFPSTSARRRRGGPGSSASSWRDHVHPGDLMNTYGPISGMTCLSAWSSCSSRSAFGICLGCKVYG